MIHPPKSASGPGKEPGGPGWGGPGWGGRRGGQPRGNGPQRGLRIAGFSIRLTGGAFVLSLLAVVAGAFTLPAAAPGWPTLAYLAATAALVAAFLGSLVAHELAHAIAARRYGVTATDIRIGFFGGTGHGRQEFRTARGLGRVAAAGPAASFVLAGISAGGALGLAALGAGRLAFVVFAVAAWINGALAVVNLLPGAGLDGGRIVQALAWARSGDRARAGATAARIGQFAGALLITGGLALLVLGYLVGLWAGLLGLVMVVASRAQAREVAAITALAGMTVRDVLPPAVPPAVPGWQTVQAFTSGGTTDAAVAGGATAFGVCDFDGRPAGVVTLSQLAALPPGHRDTVRVSEVATPVAAMVTTTPDEPLNHLMPRLAVRPATPAALHTAGHALVLGEDGTVLGVLTPADFARAGRLGMAHAGWPAR